MSSPMVESTACRMCGQDCAEFGGLTNTGCNCAAPLCSGCVTAALVNACTPVPDRVRSTERYAVGLLPSGAQCPACRADVDLTPVADLPAFAELVQLASTVDRHCFYVSNGDGWLPLTNFQLSLLHAPRLDTGAARHLLDEVTLLPRISNELRGCLDAYHSEIGYDNVLRGNADVEAHVRAVLEVARRDLAIAGSMLRALIGAAEQPDDKLVVCPDLSAYRDEIAGSWWNLADATAALNEEHRRWLTDPEADRSEEERALRATMFTQLAEPLTAYVQHWLAWARHALQEAGRLELLVDKARIALGFKEIG
ncbi:hypothetical protein [Lentzea sp. E54]|uniref:hypothetical protein n=1 Tax=Lentzea xerophila TaxID=3435883 RepID=UPI003DA2A8B1